MNRKRKASVCGQCERQQKGGRQILEIAVQRAAAAAAERDEYR